MIKHIAKGTLAGLLVMSAIPAAATEAPAGNAQPTTAKKEKKVCSYVEEMGTRMRKKVCMSEAEFEREKKAGNVD